MYSHVNGDECPSFDGDPTHVDPSLGISVTWAPISVYSRPVSRRLRTPILPPFITYVFEAARFRYVATFPKGTNAILPTIREPTLLYPLDAYTHEPFVWHPCSYLYFPFSNFTSKRKAKRKSSIFFKQLRRERGYGRGYINTRKDSSKDVIGSE